MDVKAKVQELTGSAEYLTIKWRRYKSCQAWIGTIGDYSLIKSYKTIVGLVDDENRKFYELGKYSRTTSRQMTRIYNDLYPFCEREFVGKE